MTAVWKVVVDINVETTTHRVPHDAEIIHVGADPQLARTFGVWFTTEGDQKEPPKRWEFSVVGTGHDFSSRDYVGSVLDGPFIWHLLISKDSDSWRAL